MNTTLHIDNYSKNLISTKELGQVQITFNNPRWFADLYQDKRVHKKNAEYYALRTLLMAVHNSESQFRQYEVDNSNAKDLARSIFLDKQWLIEDVTLAVCTNSTYRYFIVGGRHRLTAIASVFAQCINHKYSNQESSDDQKQAFFDAALDQEIRCNVVYVTEFDDLVALIEANNASRNMRKSESKHIGIQQYGADSSTIESVAETIFSNELTNKEMIELGANNFTRRDSKLKPQTLYIYGEKIAKWALFGLRPGDKLKDTTPLVVSTPDEFNERMQLGWEVFEETTQDIIVVARNINPLSAEIVDKLEKLWG